MHEVQVTRTIGIPADEAWKILDDFGGVYQYHPEVDHSPVTNGVTSGLGAERVCHFDNGGKITERITGYEPGRGFTVEITDPGTFPLHRAVAHFRVETDGAERSSVHCTMRFQPKFGPVGWLMGKTVMRAQFRKILTSVLAGLETHAKTGDVVSRKASRNVA
jgi:hypothetical protein